MILTSDETYPVIEQWRANGQPVNGDVAQTIASWWYSPGDPAMVEFVTRGRITDRDAFRSEVERERDSVRDLPEHEELDALLGWLDLT